MKVNKILIIIIAMYAMIGIANAETKSSVEKAEELLNHSNTYYWLSRARNNVLKDVNKSLEYAKEAKQILEKEEKNAEILVLLNRANAAISDAENQANFNSGYLWDFSQMMPLLLGGDDEIYEDYDDINNVAIDRSLNALFDQISDLEFKYQLNIITLDSNKNIANEEVAQTFLNANTPYYALTKHELLSVISESELNDLYNEKYKESTMKKLTNAFSREGIGFLRITKNDEVGKLIYVTSMFSFWNSRYKSIGNSFVADGFCERPASQWWIYLFILIGLPLTIIYNTLNKNKSKGSFPPFWFGIAIAAFITIFEYMTFSGLQSSEIVDSGAIVTSPQGLLGIGILLIVLSVLPPLISYISAIKIGAVSKILNNPETISTIISCSVVGGIVYLSSIAILVFNPEIVLINGGIAIIATLYPSYAIGKKYSICNLQEDFVSGLQAALILISNSVLFYFFIKYNTTNLIICAAVINLYTIIIHLLLPLIIKLFANINEKASDNGNKLLKGVKWLQDKLDNPPFYHCNKKLFDQAVSWITDDDDDKIDMIFIEADQGCGKTRFAFEVAEKICEIDNAEKMSKMGRELKKDEKAIILFGDCDEPIGGGAVTPYEPFAQALGDFLDVGQFSNPAEKAEKLKSGLTGLAIDAAMNASGVGAFSSLLGAEEGGDSAKTNTAEMTRVIAETLTNISTSRKIIFILDDTQWMDDETFELFESLINELSDNFNDNQINFILTSRKVDDTDKIKDMFSRLDNTDSEDKTDIIDVFYVSEEHLQSESIVQGVLENLKFDFNAQEKLSGYFEGETRPLPVLMTLKLLLDRNYIVEIGDMFELDNGVDLSALPKPDYYAEMLVELTNDLSLREINILQCSAIIGRQFDITIVAKIFGTSVIDCLELMKKAVDKNIIRDVVEEDGLFEFVEKRVASMFKVLNNEADGNLSQEVREYHKRYVELKKDCDITKMSYADIVKVAQHATAVKDVYPELMVKYNRLAAIKTQNRGLLKSAEKFFANASEVLEARKSIISNEEIAEFYLCYSKCLLDQEKDVSFVQDVITKMKENLQQSEQNDFTIRSKKYYETELKLIEILMLFKSRDFDEALAESEIIINDSQVSPSQKMRALFYRAISWNRQEYDKCKELHLDVFDKIEELLKTNELSNEEKIEILKVKSELANNLGFVTMRSEPELALNYFRIAIEVNKLPTINDQKGIGIANGGIGDCLSAQGDLEGAREAYLINYSISKTNGDKQGIGRMSSMLGGLIIRQLTEDNRDEQLKEAERYYRESLSVAIEQQNGISIAFALAGLINVEAHAETPKMDYIITKYSEFSPDGVPNFAIEALNDSISKIVAKHPDIRGKFDK